LAPDDVERRLAARLDLGPPPAMVVTQLPFLKACEHGLDVVKAMADVTADVTRHDSDRLPPILLVRHRMDHVRQLAQDGDDREDRSRKVLGCAAVLGSKQLLLTKGSGHHSADSWESSGRSRDRGLGLRNPARGYRELGNCFQFLKGMPV